MFFTIDMGYSKWFIVRNFTWSQERCLVRKILTSGSVPRHIICWFHYQDMGLVWSDMCQDIWGTHKFSFKDMLYNQRDAAYIKVQPLVLNWKVDCKLILKKVAKQNNHSSNKTSHSFYSLKKHHSWFHFPGHLRNEIL